MTKILRIFLFWEHTDSLLKKKSIMHSLVKKVMSTIFLNMKRLLLISKKKKYDSKQCFQLATLLRQNLLSLLNNTRSCGNLLHAIIGLVQTFPVWTFWKIFYLFNKNDWKKKHIRIYRISFILYLIIRTCSVRKKKKLVVSFHFCMHLPTRNKQDITKSEFISKSDVI